MKCPVCRPHANAHRAVHCPIGLKLFRGFEQAAQDYAHLAMQSTGGAFNAKRINEAKAAKDLAHQHYRAHVEHNWNPNKPEAA